MVTALIQMMVAMMEMVVIDDHNLPVEVRDYRYKIFGVELQRN